MLEVTIITDGWIRCPRCNNKAFPVDNDTALHNPVWRCKRCKEEFAINIRPATKSIPIWELSKEEQEERVRSAYERDGFSAEDASFIAGRWDRF